jgi:hypothetical protein
LAVPELLLALIRENAAPLFWDIPDSKPVWLSGAFSKLKITANSTYWKAKVGKDGLEDETEFREVIEGRLRAVKKFSRAFF